MDIAGDAGGAGSKRSRARRQARRPRLLSAAIEIACTRGCSALTTNNIAAAAGVTQSSFYTYFKNVDECVQAMADELTARAQHVERQLAQAGLFAIIDDEDDHVRVERVKLAFSLWAADPVLTSLLLRFRTDQSPLGASAREAQGRLIDAVFEGLLDFALRRRDRFCAQSAEVLATMLVGSFMQGLELVASRAVPDTERIAFTLARAHRALVRAELRRMATAEPQSATVIPEALVVPQRSSDPRDDQSADSARLDRR